MVSRGWRIITSTIATWGLGCTRLIIGSCFVIRNPTVKPFKVLGILDRNVRVFDNSHENVLDDRDQEEEEAVHEEDRVEETDLFHGDKGVKECIASLYREHGVHTRSEATKALREGPHHTHVEEAHANVDRQDSYPDSHDERDGLFECSGDHIVILRIRQILDYRAPSAKGAKTDE